MGARPHYNREYPIKDLKKAMDLIAGARIDMIRGEETGWVIIIADKVLNKLRELIGILEVRDGK